MKITELETIRLGEFPNIIWVRIHTDEGLVPVWPVWRCST